MAERWSAEIAGLEAINAWTHGLGFLVSLPACLAITLIAVQEDKSMITPCLVYGISLSAMYFFSTLSHALREPKWRSRARAWDQGAVYLLIAGTYTPFIWAYVSGGRAISCSDCLADCGSRVLLENRGGPSTEQHDVDHVCVIGLDSRHDAGN